MVAVVVVAAAFEALVYSGSAHTPVVAQLVIRGAPGEEG
jgi:hypothetical protein